MLRTTNQVADRYTDVILIEMYTRLNPHINREHVPAAWVKANHGWLKQIVVEAYGHMEHAELEKH